MPRYIDLTAELMGDPTAAFRRAPTPDEAARPNQQGGFNLAAHMKREGRTVGPYTSWQIGETRTLCNSRHMANARHRALEKHGIRLVGKRQPDGKYLVTRVE
jgi:hypothetical protein